MGFLDSILGAATGKSDASGGVTPSEKFVRASSSIHG
jgi:penicillin V acylase-like amidase (Ntn superfamily)